MTWTLETLIRNDRLPLTSAEFRADCKRTLDRDGVHRVTPVKGGRTRMLVVLAYNTEPDVSLSESARMTFYGRLG